MKISKNCKIELVASKDSTRLALINPYLQGSKLIASDGHRLVAIPVEREEGDSDGPMDCSAFKLSRKTSSGEKLSKISANGCLKVHTKDGVLRTLIFLIGKKFCLLLIEEGSKYLLTQNIFTK